MTKKKKTWIIIGAIFGSILLMIEFVIALTFPWNIIYIGALLNSEDPPQPEVSYAEFPFELVYEIDGERKTIKDTLVIKHEGVNWDEGYGGKYNNWFVYRKESCWAGTNVEIYEGYSEKLGIKCTLYFELGSCEYYMGLEETDSYLTKDMQPGDFYVYSTSYIDVISDEELYEHFGIKIIKKTLSPPIKRKTGDGTVS